ncbi:hypothetical protein [Prevotella sp. kh1p2]|uniref:hypothetical protein n=1 Tax=Prevotella sp. kh1p2 TaxID=1761883 RepID=UPI0008B147B8|nr:hypothetical protein [Prevotella sp. kh1p2]SET17657.1 hypothetical protein SAMN04487825_11844 [Prevotella sp. kh1p2]SNU12035.1 hypothetical protein SAMN06298210_11719 [Prevotellaceae bacterium KH2P17]
MITLILFYAFLFLLCLHVSRKKGVPLLLMVFSLVPFAIAPLLLFMSIFFFDNPSVEWYAWLAFAGINGYSLLILVGAYCSVRLYGKGHRRWAWALPTVFHVINITFLGYLFLS